MRPFITFLLLLFNLPQAEAQINLVPNPSFEDTLNCDSFQIYQAGFPWFNPTDCTPDYYYGLSPTCGNSALQNQNRYQLPYDGNAYVGIYLADPIWGFINTRDYICVELIDTLKFSKEYFVEFYISRSNNFALATDDIGAYLSSQVPINTGCSYLPYQPQIENTQGNIITDSLNWTKISGVFTAQGGEKYLTIGNFKDSINTTIIDADNGNGLNNNSYYYIDKISLIPLDSIQGLNESLNKTELIFVYPSLLQTGSQIHIMSKQNHDVTFALYTIEGKFVKNGIIHFGDNLISSEGLNSGVYLIRIIMGSSIVSKKIIIY